MRLSVEIVKVFVDATYRAGTGAWGAVAMVEGRKPHVFGGRLRGIRNSNILEMVALRRAESGVQRWLKRRRLKARLLVLHSDNQGIADMLAEQRGTQKLVHRWLSRDHPAMRYAHRIARLRAANYASSLGGVAQALR